MDTFIGTRRRGGYVYDDEFMNNLNELKRCIDELEGEPPKNKRHNLKFIIKNSILVHIYYRTIFLYHFHIKYIDIETYDLT